MPAVSIPGWDVATVNNMAIKFAPSSPHLGERKKISWFFFTS
jgi:hypothetical protein